MIILVDQDDVLADFDGRVREIMREKYPDKACLLRADRKTTNFYEDEHKAGLEEITVSIYHAQGFFYSLKPIQGGKETLNTMKQSGVEVFICTSPIRNYENCVIEKYCWVEKYLGREWTTRMILTRDKTIVKGDFLIDDNPDPKGVAKPQWEHILYDRPYNRQILQKRRLTWQNWKSVITL